MKKLLLAALLLSAGPTFADGHGHGGHGGSWGGWIVPPLIIGSVIGYSLARPPYAYPPYAYPTEPYLYQPAPYPYVYVPAAPPEPATVPAMYVYYYCEAAKGYYPYVSQCPGGWKNVPAIPSQ